MSQITFNDYLNVGIALKNWEIYYIQDSSQDDHIRLKCDPIFAAKNLFLNQQLNDQPNMYNGMKKFSFSLFKHTTLFFLQNAEFCSQSITSLLFYVDFLNFKLHQKSITGTRYLTFKSGPCPDRWTLLSAILENEKSITKSGDCYQFEEGPDMSLFDDAEKKNLSYVCDGHNDKKQSLTLLSQREKAFTDVNDHCYVSYSHAASLLI